MDWREYELNLAEAYYRVLDSRHEEARAAVEQVVWKLCRPEEYAERAGRALTKEQVKSLKRARKALDTDRRYGNWGAYAAGMEKAFSAGSENQFFSRQRQAEGTARGLADQWTREKSDRNAAYRARQNAIFNDRLQRRLIERADSLGSYYSTLEYNRLKRY